VLAAVARVAFLDDFDSLLLPPVLLATAEETGEDTPEAAGNAAEAAENEESQAGNDANDDAGNGTTAQLATGRCCVGRSSLLWAVSRHGSGAADNARGHGCATCRPIWGRELCRDNIAGGHNIRPRVLAGIGKTLAFDGVRAPLPGCATDGTTCDLTGALRRDTRLAGRRRVSGSIKGA